MKTSTKSYLRVDSVNYLQNRMARRAFSVCKKHDNVRMKHGPGEVK